MSTRTNIVIKRGNELVQLYHHADGYPSGVGKDLQDGFALMKSEINGNDMLCALKSPMVFWLCLKNFIRYSNTYEDDGRSLQLHGDIEYVYVIDLCDKSITCYEYDSWKSQTPDMDVVKGKAKDARTVYKASILDEWDDIDVD